MSAGTHGKAVKGHAFWYWGRWPRCLGKKHGDWFDLCDDCMEHWLKPDTTERCEPPKPPDDPTEAEMETIAEVPYDRGDRTGCPLCKPSIPCYRHMATRFAEGDS